jgi:hypothetical protein
MLGLVLGMGLWYVVYLRSVPKPGKVYGPPGVQLEISSKEVWKKHTLFGQKHTQIGRREGG